MFEPLVTLPPTLSDVEGRWILIDGRANVLLVDGAFPLSVRSPVEGSNPHLLGVESVSDGSKRPVWTLYVNPVKQDLGEWGETGEFVNMRPLFGQVPDTDWALAGRASQVLTWARDHKFCGRCGTETESHDRDRARKCPSCGLHSFPRISPAVIMLVERMTDSGPEVLLAWGRQFPGRFFSALAGFLEPGESLEECVIREVAEETSIVVDNVQYFGSQPWPFPHSIMIGFTASYVSGEIEIQEEEIVEAGWFGPNELPPVPRGGPVSSSDGGGMSIAGWMVEAWLAGLS